MSASAIIDRANAAAFGAVSLLPSPAFALATAAVGVWAIRKWTRPLAPVERAPPRVSAREYYPHPGQDGGDASTRPPVGDDSGRISRQDTTSSQMHLVHPHVGPAQVGRVAANEAARPTPAPPQGWMGIAEPHLNGPAGQ